MFLSYTHNIVFDTAVWERSSHIFSRCLASHSLTVSLLALSANGTEILGKKKKRKKGKAWALRVFACLSSTSNWVRWIEEMANTRAHINLKQRLPIQKYHFTATWCLLLKMELFYIAWLQSNNPDNPKFCCYIDSLKNVNQSSYRKYWPSGKVPKSWQQWWQQTDPHRTLPKPFAPLRMEPHSLCGWSL